MSDKNRKYATAQHPTIAALVQGLYKYKDRKQAVARLKNITSHFVLSKEQPESTEEHPAAMLWIRGFAVTEQEAAKGYTGHFAQVQVVKLDSGVYSLSATRIDKPLANHPQKKRLQSKHPNWGHPVMRAVKKQKIYETVDAAQAELDLLHLEFPEVSIPGPAKLYIIIYEKREGIARPTHKIALEIKTYADGGFIIAARDNEKQSKPKIPALDGDAPKKAAPQGFYTSMVALKKKRRKGGRPVTGLKPEESGE